MPEHVDVGEHLGVVDAREVQLAGEHAGGEHDAIELAQGLAGRLRVQAHLDAGELQALVEVAQRLVELFFAGHLLGHVELTADAVGALEERDGVSALRGGARIGEPRGSGADYRDGLAAAHREDLQLPLVTGARIHQARRALVLEDVIEARLIAGDAGVDLVFTAVARFDHPIGVGEEGARHAHHVGAAIGEHLLGDGGHVDAVRGDERDADVSHHLLGDPGETGARDHGGDRRDACFVPADARVEDAGAGLFDLLGELDDLFPAAPVLD